MNISEVKEIQQGDIIGNPGAVPYDTPPAYTECSETVEAGATLPNGRPVLPSQNSDSTDTSNKMSSEIAAQMVLGDITGGWGGTGGEARIGGDGGEGEGPKLYIDPDQPRKFRNISGEHLLSYPSRCLHPAGGTGGTGGVGVEVGGTGGTGRGPVISVLRRSIITPRTPKPDSTPSDDMPASSFSQNSDSTLRGSEGHVEDDDVVFQLLACPCSVQPKSSFPLFAFICSASFHVYLFPCTLPLGIGIYIDSAMKKSTVQAAHRVVVDM
ncbi:hypothetical protein B0H13DRAFT_1857062 [Mycena leptocephala]|nr:hypothetical protein B0H13DRAFT_1857062 [Mycena leptocephala]